MVITRQELIKRLSKCFIDSKNPAYTIINLETHLEDINIINDLDVTSNSVTSINESPCTVNDFLNRFADFMTNFGFEKSFSILNTFRFSFNEKDMIKDILTIKDWVTIVRSTVGTVNTTLRYKDISIDG